MFVCVHSLHQVSPPTQAKRIFVGGVSSDSEELDLKGYFEQFGKVKLSSSLVVEWLWFGRTLVDSFFPLGLQIKEAQLMFDKNTRRHRGGCGLNGVWVWLKNWI